MNNSPDADLAGLEPPPDEERLSPKMRAWRRLVKIAPNLQRFEPFSVNEPTAPRPISDGLFLALCAAFADPVKRDILRALILDLLADDMADIIVGFLTEEEK